MIIIVFFNLFTFVAMRESSEKEQKGPKNISGFMIVTAA